MFRTPGPIGHTTPFHNNGFRRGKTGEYFPSSDAEAGKDKEVHQSREYEKRRNVIDVP
jgi:hypothetical protein